MTKTNLKKQIAEAASAFSLSIIEAVKGASLQELMELQTSGAVAKPARKKPGPKPGRKAAAKKPGPKPKVKKVAKVTKAKPGPKKGVKKVKPGPKKGIKKAKPGPKKVVKKAKIVKKAKRAAKVNKTELHENIVAYLKKNPSCSAGVICKTFKLNPWTARRHMQQLEKAGKVDIKGEKAKTRYSAK
ncbi:MAG: winged helix-turn-helix transcriptional regulator [Proteobacteria bacterium]|nr:winged helix-turn-helix transcriptional regulator [Pseudomonadota bacterium]